MPRSAPVGRLRSVDPKDSDGRGLAPGAPQRDGPVAAPSRDEPPVPIDRNFLQEDCGYEVLGGRLLELSPAEEEHATEHFQLPAVLGSVLAPGYKGAVDMLTRPEKVTNFAPDVSILPTARDPQTGGRQVEEVVFEVVDTQSYNDAGYKASKLCQRGVRRVFLIDVKLRRCFEWTREPEDWRELDAEETLVDRCFAAPVPVRARLDACEEEARLLSWLARAGAAGSWRELLDAG